MSNLFFDSSALVKRYIQEAGTERVLAIVESDERISVSRLAHVEITATVVRRARAGDLAPDDANAILAKLEDEMTVRFRVADVNTPTLIRAVDQAKSHGLRAADAIQLACALAVSGPGNDLTFVSSDQELNAAAQAEGLEVLDPARD